MKSLRIASLLAMLVTCIAIAYAAGGVGAPDAAARPGKFILAQGANACLNACREKMQSCMAQIDPTCNSKGCNNERGACNEQYNDCTKGCSGR